MERIFTLRRHFGEHFLMFGVRGHRSIYNRKKGARKKSCQKFCPREIRIPANFWSSAAKISKKLLISINIIAAINLKSSKTIFQLGIRVLFSLIALAQGSKTDFEKLGRFSNVQQRPAKVFSRWIRKRKFTFI